MKKSRQIVEEDDSSMFISDLDSERFADLKSSFDGSEDNDDSYVFKKPPP